MAFTPAYRENPSRIPTYEELGGGLKENLPEFVDIPDYMPKAEEHNQISGSIASHAVMGLKAVLSIVHTAGTYSKVSLRTVNSDATLTDVTVTKNGVGDLTITFVVGKIPPLVFAPLVCFNGVAVSTRTYESQLVNDHTVSVRFSNAGVATDAFATIWFL